MYTIRLAAILLFLFPLVLPAQQQTVGLFQITPQAAGGYNLFTPLSSTTTYLIDNCGRERHRWAGTTPPGSSTYLQPDGQLLRTGRATSTVFNGGGIGGRVERVDWNGNVTWSYQYATPLVHQHHDVELLPNGNILLLAWEAKTSTEATAAGRNPTNAPMGLWPEHIVELQPIGQDSADIVWEWHVWDHLVQDFDSTQANFGVVADHPELIDINYTGQNGGGPIGQRDWLHCNSVAYNAALDQIVLSSRNFNELWVIDHSTTTAQAASHSGGNSGKGGDILYRWGNPEAYDRGTGADRQFFLQHDARWIPDSLPGGGGLMVYNNGTGRPGGNYSTVDVIVPPVDAQGNYSIVPTQAFAPASPDWTYSAPTPTDFYSTNISGASRMPNGNTLICEGSTGTFFEVDSAGTVVWEYINPISLGFPVAQGDIPFGNPVFRVERYAADYAGFQGQSLPIGSELEVNPLPPLPLCEPIAVLPGEAAEWKVGPSPFADQLRIHNPLPQYAQAVLYDLSGRQVRNFALRTGDNALPTADLPTGLYLMQVPEVPGLAWKVVRQ